jgi:long-chain acyl-CoA synthetase
MLLNSLVDAVVHYAQFNPDKVCLIEADSGRSLTYSEFWRLSRALAVRLVQYGVQKGDRITVRVGDFVETMITQFGIYLIGGVYCPVEKHMNDLKLIEMLKYFDSTVLISTRPLEYEGIWIDLNKVCKSDFDINCEFNLPGSDDFCAIIFTTGTTGKAKGVMLNHGACVLFSEIRKEVCSFTDKDVFLWTTPLDRISGLRMFGPVFAAGGTAVHFSSTIFTKDFFDVIGDYSVTSIQLNPHMLAILLEGDPDSFLKYAEQIRFMTFGGSNLTEKYKDKIKSLLPNSKLFIFYGATEASPLTCLEFSNCQSKPRCVGKSFVEDEIGFIGDDGNLFNASEKEPGTIVYKNKKGMMNGYWKDEALTAQVKKDDYLITTDLGYMDSEGFLYIIGRRDDVIVSGGYKIAPYEIEDVVLQMQDISQCACVGVENSVLGKVPKLFVVMKKGSKFSAKVIFEYLSKRLETFKLPRAIVEIETIPVIGPNQKIDKRRLANYV